MAAGAVVTVPFCGACGWDVNGPGNDGNQNDDVFCDGCGADLEDYGFAGLLAPTDLVGITKTDEVDFTWTTALDTTDILYSIDGAEPVLDDDAASPYTVTAVAVKKVSASIRTVLNSVAGPWSSIVSALSGQAPPTVLTAVAASLAVDFTFTADPAGDSVDLLYDIDAGDSVLVKGVVTGVSIAALEGEVVSGQVRTVEDGSLGEYSAADSETALA